MTRTDGQATRNIESPFLEAFVWSPGGTAAPARVESPFLNAYAEETLFEGVNPDAEEVRSTLGELYDLEFDEALYELAHEAAAIADRSPRTYGGADAADRLLEAWVEPLRAESEQLFENLAGTFARRPVGGLGDEELERLVDEAAQPGRPLEPVFEQFFKKLVKKAKGVVQKAAGIAKKGIALAQKLSPVHMLLGKLKALVKPLLQKVLQMALDKLPPALRPAASTLAKRLAGNVGLEAETSADHEASADPGLIQREFDEAVVQLMFAAEGAPQELMLLELSGDFERTAPIGSDVRQLDAARAQFVSELSHAEPEGAGPAVEQFIPAVLPALRLGIRLLGRPRVVSTLARLVGQLIGRFVGPQATPALSRAIVDTGMKLMSLEAPEQEAAAGPHAIASTIEDVVRRVSEASDEVLDDSRLLEAEVADAFNRAAAAHFPQQMLNEDKRESTTAGGTWVMFPKGGYKKYTRVFDVELTPDLARSIKTFGGTTLEAFLKDRLRLDVPVRARVHLYEAVPGTWISRIVRAERGVAGLGAGRKGAWALFHPLTAQNAASLLREPGLGRDVSGRFTATPRQLAVGQRVFYLEIPGAPSRPLARAGGVDVVADFPKNELRLSVFLAERQAQSIAQRLNGGAGVGSVLGALKELVSNGVRSALSGEVRGRVRILHESVDGEGFLGGALKRVGTVVLEQFSGKVSDWSMKAIADHLQQHAASFVSAVQEPADGVTVRITLQSPPGFSLLRTQLRGRGGLPLSNLGSVFKGAPAASVQVVPGYPA
ncbi:MAG: hypothetical protein WBV82_12315 [Myxococcaceae bacterium]